MMATCVLAMPPIIRARSGRWLIGPYIDAWLKLHPGKTSEARQFLSGFPPHLGEACVGSISEIFDGEEPHVPRACIAQAWSVAEVLRSWANTA